MELHLSLVSKVCTELETHVGCSNKTLAECIIELGRRSESVKKFCGKLKENGAEFPDDFVKRLLAIIHAIFPPMRKDKDRHRGREEDRDHKEKERGKEERDCARDRDGERHRDTDSSGRSSSSPERFEITQLAASGVVGMRNNPMHDDDGGGMLYDDEGEEEELEIELNEDEPAFLRGLTRYSVDLSPVKIVRNPDGSLQRAALALAKLREQQQRTMLDSRLEFQNCIGSSGGS